MIPTNAQPVAIRPKAIKSKSGRTPPPFPANLTKANLPTTAKTKAKPSQAHQGNSDGSINIAAQYMLSIGPLGPPQNDRHDGHTPVLNM
jgi:hypothetical protein